MKRFRQYTQELKEALEPRAGENTGWEERHPYTHNGEEHEAVVNIVHKGDGHYKIIAQTGPKGRPSFNNEHPPGLLGAKVASKIQKTVETFLAKHDWNSAEFGGTTSRNREHYKNWAKEKFGDTGKFKLKLGKMPFQAAAVIKRKEPISQPKLSGAGDKKSDDYYDHKHGPSGKFGLSGHKGPSGKKKLKPTDDVASGASSVGSAAGSEGSAK